MSHSHCAWIRIGAAALLATFGFLGCGHSAPPATDTALGSGREAPAPSAGVATTASAPLSKEQWLDTFPAYPGAVQRCWEHVSSNTMHIIWFAYTTDDAPDKVVAFYKQALPDAAAGEGALLAVHKQEKDLSVYPKGANYPKCPPNPKYDERATVIIISGASK